MKCIYSAGGYARELMRCGRQAFENDDFQLIDDAKGKLSITYDDLLKNRSSNDEILIAFADPKLRKIKTEQILSDGFKQFNIISKTAILGDNVEYGAGCAFSDFTIVTADAKIGDSFQCNIYSYVAHDCVIGNYVTLAPRVSINGRVIIEDGVYIGTAATILPGTMEKPRVIGRGSVIGAHALVTKDVEPEAVVVGMPAKPIVKSNA